MPLAVLLEFRTFDALVGVRIHRQPALVDRQPAFHTRAILARIDTLQRSRNLAQFLACLVAQRIDDLIVLEFLRALFRIRMVATANVGMNTIQALRQLLPSSLNGRLHRRYCTAWHSPKRKLRP